MSRSSGFVQFLPLILLALFAAATFVIVRQVQVQQEDIRSRAAESNYRLCLKNVDDPKECENLKPKPQEKTKPKETVQNPPTPTPTPALANRYTLDQRGGSFVCERDSNGEYATRSDCESQANAKNTERSKPTPTQPPAQKAQPTPTPTQQPAPPQVAIRCGDGVCSSGETAASCPGDCGAVTPPKTTGFSLVNGQCRAGGPYPSLRECVDELNRQLAARPKPTPTPPKNGGGCDGFKEGTVALGGQAYTDPGYTRQARRICEYDPKLGYSVWNHCSDCPLTIIPPDSVDTKKYQDEVQKVQTASNQYAQSVDTCMQSGGKTQAQCETEAQTNIAALGFSGKAAQIVTQQVLSVYDQKKKEDAYFDAYDKAQQCLKTNTARPASCDRLVAAANNLYGATGLTVSNRDRGYHNWLVNKITNEYVTQGLALDACKAKQGAGAIDCDRLAIQFGKLLGDPLLTDEDRKGITGQLSLVQFQNKQLSDHINAYMKGSVTGFRSACLGDASLARVSTRDRSEICPDEGKSMVYLEKEINTLGGTQTLIAVQNQIKEYKASLTYEGALPQKPYCKASQCVVAGHDETGKLQENAVNVASPYAFYCPGSCGVFGAATNQGKMVDVQFLNQQNQLIPTQVPAGYKPYCDPADPTGRTVRQANAWKDFWNTLLTRDTSASGGDVKQVCSIGCSNGKCVEGIIAKDPGTSAPHLCEAGKTCSAIDPVTGLPVNYTLVPVGKQEGGETQYAPQIDWTGQNRDAKARFIALYNSKLDPYMQNHFSPEVVTAFGEYRQTNPDAVIEDFQRQQLADGQALKDKILHSTSWWLNSEHRVNIQSIFTDDPDWLTRAVLSGQVDVGKVQKDLTSLEARLLPTETQKCISASNPNAQSSPECLAIKTKLQVDTDKIFYDAYRASVPTATRTQADAAFLTSTAFSQCKAQGVSDVSQCRFNTFHDYLAIKHDADFYMQSAGIMDRNASALYALNGSVDYSGLKKAFDDPWVKAGTWLNEHTNGAVLAGRLRASEGAAEWKKDGPSFDAGYKVASGWTMQGAQLMGEGLMLGTGIGSIVNLAGETLTWRAVVQIGSTMLSAKMTGDSLAQTARVCYQIDSTEKGMSCAGSGVMTFVAGASFLQGAQQVGLLWENANTVAAVSKASTKAVQYGVEEVSVREGVKKSIQVIGDQSVLGKSFLQSEAFNRVLGAGQLVAFGLPAGEACSKGDWSNCLLNGGMALLGGYRAIAPITFGATPETKV
ncbi:hypothetical protein HY031_01810, partial [Candidatus Gottesmanbacteria bacterium]|nr:hypothetical protein [Candidatus Gottesmanbacteria bacterium]